MFYNNDKFERFQMKARNRAIATTAVAIPPIFIVLNGGKNGLGYIYKHKYISAGIIISLFVGSFSFWHRVKGYNN